MMRSNKAMQTDGRFAAAADRQDVRPHEEVRDLTADAINTRNEALEFARRARKNLAFIEKAAGDKPDSGVHVVTQLTLSLLGIIVFPKENLFLDQVETMKLSTLEADGWPMWVIARDDDKAPTLTLGQILKHLRNAVAHGRISYTSDSPLIENVSLLVEDKRRREDSEPYWRAEIKAEHLRSFCDRFFTLIDETIG
jgi:hypothetical protein